MDRDVHRLRLRGHRRRGDQRGQGGHRGAQDDAHAQPQLQRPLPRRGARDRGLLGQGPDALLRLLVPPLRDVGVHAQPGLQHRPVHRQLPGHVRRVDALDHDLAQRQPAVDAPQVRRPVPTVLGSAHAELPGRGRDGHGGRVAQDRDAGAVGEQQQRVH